MHDRCAMLRGVKQVADEWCEEELLLLLSTCWCKLLFSQYNLPLCLNTCSFTSKIHIKKSFLMNRESDSTHKTTGVVVSDRLGVTKSLQQRV